MAGKESAPARTGGAGGEMSHRIIGDDQPDRHTGAVDPISVSEEKYPRCPWCNVRFANEKSRQDHMCFCDSRKSPDHMKFPTHIRQVRR